ncbi:MAG TPA: hypothetical protein PLP61_05995 [Nocardioides sp.]|uniref:hypothetical protein n=1 Tax=Nocardioides sp. TaxID=35761 RepID=UPI002D0A610E|nr:hypothetical protein [Nocardioides sp.]HQR26575.1 hypothetical protein [Nocardioides sp.]
MNNADDVTRLQARVAELEAQLAADEAARSEEKHRTRSVWRSVTSAVALTLACVLAPLSVTSVWASTQISDTDAYVRTVAPIADDPDVQAAIADQVTTAVMDSLDVSGLTSEALQTLADQPNMPPRIAAALPALAVPLTNGIESFTQDQVESFLASDDFDVVWAEVNRIAHEQVVALLEGNQGGAVSAQNDTVTLNLAPIIEEVKQRLVDRGFTLASNVPAVDKSFVLVQNEGISKVQRLYRVLNAMGAWLPFIVLGLLVVGVALAHDRRRALLRGALGITAALVLLGATLTMVRLWYVQSTPAGVLTPDAAGRVYDDLIRFLRTGLRATAVLGLVLALGAYLAGPSSSAVRTRTSLQQGIGSMRGSAEAAGFQTGRFGQWVYRHRIGLRVSTLIAAGVWLMFWDRPTLWTVLGVALLAVLVLGVIEFLGRPPAPASPAPAAEDTVPLPVSAGTTADSEPTERLGTQDGHGD